MVQPQDVSAPKEKIKVLSIIENGTKTKKGYSTAFVKWKEKKTIAVRWDGDNRLDKGFPVTTNGYHPSWFILPERLASLYSQDFVHTQQALDDLEKYLKKREDLNE